MSDASLEGTVEGPPARKPTPWSVRKIVEQVTGRPLESMQDPPSSRRTARAPASKDPPLEEYHQELPSGPQVALLVRPELVDDPPSASPDLRAFETEPASSSGANSPSLKAFLPGASLPPRANRPAPHPPALPITRPLPPEVVEEVERMRSEEGEPPLAPREGSHGHRRSELERVYLSYLLMHLDKLTEPALK